MTFKSNEGIRDSYSDGSDETPPNHSSSTPPSRRKGGTVLFVGNLPFGTPWQRIKDWFRSAGAVRYTDLIADRDGRPKGSAIVTMVSATDAERAIAKLNESEFDGRRLIVRYFHEDHSRRPRLVQRDLMPEYTEGGHYKKGGGVRVKGSEKDAEKTRGYSTGELLDPSASDICILSEEWRKSREKYAKKGCWICVNNLPLNCTVETLEMTFAQVGKPLISQLLGTLLGKGLGRLLMQSPEEAQFAITEFDGITMAGCEMRVALEREEDRKLYANVIRLVQK